METHKLGVTSIDSVRSRIIISSIVKRFRGGSFHPHRLQEIIIARNVFDIRIPLNWFTVAWNLFEKCDRTFMIPMNWS